ncbi:unnamed protein product [Prunus brigantina]
MKEEALKLISDGLERKLLSVLQDHLSSNHPEQMASFCILMGCAVLHLTACLTIFDYNVDTGVLEADEKLFSILSFTRLPIYI